MHEIFEIKAKDGAGRIGKLVTPHGTIETPAFVPVINPHLPIISTDDLKKLGYEIFITNSYLLYKDERLREIVLKKGIHDVYNWQGPIMTDSGAFQLMVYGDVEITNLEIIEFQKKIGVDIGVILDTPVAKGAYQKRKKSVEVTAERAKEAVDAGYVSDDSKVIWVGPIHGVPYNDLVELSVNLMTQYPFPMYAVGSIVPLMENYRALQLIKSSVVAKEKLPSRYPVHLFGAGHPAMFSLFVLVGYDSFDSAAYALYAKDDRYLTPNGSLNLRDLKYFPCECPICSRYTPQELRSMDYMARQHLLAMHNLYVSIAEIRRIKQAILDGTLWQLVAARASAHPEIARAYRWLLDHRNKRGFSFFESFEPSFKRKGLKITRPEEANLPVVQRYKRRIMNRVYIWSDRVIISTADGANYLPSTLGAQVFIISPIFGVIPREVRTVYPLFQHMSFHEKIDNNTLEFIQNFVNMLRERGVKEIFVYDSDETLAKKLGKKIGIESIYTGEDVGIIPKEEEKLHIVRGILNYQFGIDSTKIISKVDLEFSRSTGRLRKIYALDIKEIEIESVILPEIEKISKKKKKLGKEMPEGPLQELFIEKGKKWLLGAVTPSYFKIVPHALLAHRIWENFRDNMRYMICVRDDAEPFIRDGKSIFSKFVLDADSEIRAEDEIFVLNESKELLAIAKAVIGAREMLEFRRGIAAENRWGFSYRK